MSIKRMAGVTLVELIIAIVIVGTALAGLVAAYNRANIASADPLITQQKLAIAESMMEEIMQKPFEVDTQAAADRRFFNDVRDYHSYTSNGIRNVNGDAIAGLARYRVAVSVADAGLQGVPAGESLRIRVAAGIIGAPVADDIVLTGWRTKP